MKGLQKYDPYAKAIAGTSVRTSGGAIVTVFFLFLALYLVADECWQQSQILVTERLEIDPSVGQASVPISLDIEMWGLHCDDLDVMANEIKSSEQESLLPKLALQVPKHNELGCRVVGEIKVKKVAGLIRILPIAATSGAKFAKEGSLEKLMAFNASHIVHHLGFGDPFPGMEYSLDGTERIIEKGKQAGQFQYHAKIVPTTFQHLQGDITTSNQFSATAYLKTIEPVNSFGFQATIEIPGVFIKYEFSPLVVIRSETRKAFIHLVTRLLAIVGGLYTISNLINRLLHRTVLSKKQD